MRHTVLGRLGAARPLVAAPMTGGPSTPALVRAAFEAGATGFLGAGYKTAEAVEAELDELSGVDRFGVNLFVPHRAPISSEDYAAYAKRLAPLGIRYGVDTTSIGMRGDPDAWDATLALLVRRRVPLVSFTFALPPRGELDALQSAGITTIQTVTRLGEAHAAAALGVDALVIQSHLAGGHSGVFDPAADPVTSPLPDLVREIRAAVDLPLWAAGAITRPEQVRAVLDAGAEAAVVGTVLLRSPESGASDTHKAGIADPRRTETVVTRAYSGRPARGVRNAFIDEFDAMAPFGYPEVHYLTSPIRRAAAAVGDADVVNLWAGAGFRDATATPAAEILARLDPQSIPD